MASDKELAQDAELYSLLCDAIERAWQHYPVRSSAGDPYNTSSYSRQAASQLLEDMLEHRQALRRWLA